MSQAIHHRRFYIGTTAERGAFTLPSDANGAMWWDTDRELMYNWDGSAWIGTHALTSPDGTIDPVLSTDNDGQVGIGTASPSHLVHISKTITESAAAARALRIDATFDGSGNSPAAFSATSTFTPSSNTTFSFGGNFVVVSNPGSGVTMTQVNGNYIQMFTGDDSGAVTNQHAMRIAAPNYGTIKPTTSRGLFIQNQGASGITTTYGIHVTAQSGSTDNYAAFLDGRVGIGIAPQSYFHIYEAISGSIKWEYDGLDATVRTIIPNGTGDCLYRLHAEYVLRDSAAAVASGSTDVSNSASVNLTVGTNTVRLRVNADGSIDVARTAGSDTIKVAFTLLWM